MLSMLRSKSYSLRRSKFRSSLSHRTMKLTSLRMKDCSSKSKRARSAMITHNCKNPSMKRSRSSRNLKKRSSISEASTIGVTRRTWTYLLRLRHLRSTSRCCTIKIVSLKLRSISSSLKMTTLPENLRIEGLSLQLSSVMFVKTGRQFRHMAAIIQVRRALADPLKIHTKGQNVTTRMQVKLVTTSHLVDV